MRVMYKTLKIFLVIVIVFVILINIPIGSLGYRVSEEDYSHWMSETLDNDDLILSVAMLGAHDAFSNEIDMNSVVDPYESNSIFRGIPGSLLKGYLVKQAKTQSGDVSELLKSGVRYLDIRLSLIDDNWYTKHNYISGEFELIVTDIIAFLESNSGEFLLLDFQHINGVAYDSIEDYNDFKEMLQEFGILEYAFIVNDLTTVTYGDVTVNGSQSKVIIIAPFESSEGEVLEYSANIRSSWADSDDFNYVMDFLTTESEIASEHMSQFRVMQAVTTMQLSPSGIINSLTTWSLINRAGQFNEHLLNSGDLEELMSILPIVMIDNAGSNKGQITDDLMEIIIGFNEE